MTDVLRMLMLMSRNKGGQRFHLIVFRSQNIAEESEVFDVQLILPQAWLQMVAYLQYLQYLLITYLLRQYLHRQYLHSQ